MRKRSRSDPEERRSHILDEAIRIVGRHGYHGFTIQQLAQVCGMTNGGLLYHFPSKENLLVAILEERDRRDAAIVPQDVDLSARDCGSDSGYALSTVRSLLRAIVARTVAEPELARLHAVLQSEAMAPSHPAHGYFERREAMVLEEFAAMLTGHCRDPRSAARQTLAMIDGLVQQWLRANGAFDLIAQWDAAAAAILPASSAHD
ncbi:TetR/AcrR family transcriptional regulator [Novosphingobium album (ex Hu et al. 2023)]|uniref:TetR/AcrR family transcriptional regulator n=1 Tax=Novosphingobium album (ex Hu et al. 2023) TaxID=2930093 RepID=A0ABT0B722_9SPHN|nr:TetR family transcriptional regulator [Novosphingobium album (ex Hu et al. 2023)]MCJ2180829.1 TetR/AcrR family transcriptional regulator [Novosphingobium album (ex Hu et al. 2023)]